MKPTESWGSRWAELRRLSAVIVGSVIFAAGYALFFVPFRIAAGGLSGLGIVINHFTGWPVGTLYLVLNIPLLALGFWLLGRWRFLVYTLVAIFAFSAATDLIVSLSGLTTPQARLTNDMLLAAIYGGLVTGIGVGIVYRSGGTIGGTSILVRIIQQKIGAPVTQLYLLTDGAIVGVAGVVFGWNAALHALLGLFLGGIATDYVLEGPATVLSVTIITTRQKELEQTLLTGLNRGTSHWMVTGGYTGEARALVLCTIYRTQLTQMKQIVAATDPEAFVVIGTAHQALGTGFLPLIGRGGESYSPERACLRERRAVGPITGPSRDFGKVDTLEDRLIDLEMRIAFQEDALQKLSDAVARHEHLICRLGKEFELIRTALGAMGTPQLLGQDDEGPPPHY